MSTRTATLIAQSNERGLQLANTLPADLLAVFDRNADALAATDFTHRAVAVGQAAPPFSLPSATGSVVSLDTLLAEGPIVLTFYRGAWCPFCDLQLRAYQAILPAILARGARLVAVSPQTPDNSLTTAEKRHLTFTVLSDLGNVVADRYGLTFTVDVAVRDAQAALGLDLEAYNGDASYRLPVTATYVIGRDGMIAFACVSGDYRERAEPSDILAALDKL